jgi:hypothetical protein
MRSIYDAASGADVTATVQAALRSSRTLFTRWLFRFSTMNFWSTNPFGDYVNFAFTNEFPIKVNQYQVKATGAEQIGSWYEGAQQSDGILFRPEAIEFDKIDYSIGFKDHPVTVTWYIDDDEDYYGDSLAQIGLSAALNPPNLTLKKAMLNGAFNEAPFWIHQALFSDDPAHGGTFYGTTLMFRGYIRKVTAAKNKLEISIASLLDVFQDVQIPTQTITPDTRSGPYVPAAGGLYTGSWYDVYAIVSPTEIIFQPSLSATSFPQDALRDYWMTFVVDTSSSGSIWKSGYSPAPAWRIKGNDASSSSPYVTVYFYEPPVIPVSPNLSLFGQVSLSGLPYGFKYVPPPEYNI